MAAPANPADGMSKKQARAMVPVVRRYNGSCILRYLADVITKRSMVDM
jgi:hypothetical protein